MISYMIIFRFEDDHVCVDPPEDDHVDQKGLSCNLLTFLPCIQYNVMENSIIKVYYYLLFHFLQRQPCLLTLPVSMFHTECRKYCYCSKSFYSTVATIR